MDHLETKSEYEDFWSDCQDRIHDPLKKHFNERDIDRAIGLVSTNAHEIANSGELRGIYPIVSLLSHNCVRNVSLKFDGERIRCRANVHIQAGESLNISYVSSLMTKEKRRATLKEGWHFDCDCARCSNPIDLTSARICPHCQIGPAISQMNGSWRCLQCHKDFESQSSSMEDDLEEKWNEEMKHRDVNKLHLLLVEGRTFLHPNHGLLQRMRSWLIPTMCRAHHKQMDDFSTEDVCLKQQLCLESLQVLDVIEPGLTTSRGRVLYELHLCEDELFERGKLSNIQSRLSEASQCFDRECISSADGFYEASIQLALNG